MANCIIVLFIKVETFISGPFLFKILVLFLQVLYVVIFIVTENKFIETVIYVMKDYMHRTLLILRTSNVKPNYKIKSNKLNMSKFR